MTRSGRVATLEEAKAPTPRRVNHGLILAIARAKTWMQGLRDGRYQDTAEINCRLGRA
jgi:hypothetical protein